MKEKPQCLKEKAETKFKAQDFAGALKLASAAQGKDPNLPGIQQYIAAYSVHVAVYESSITTTLAVRVPDWCGVLDISDNSFDTDMIKKQYKRMALLVHPDKNDSVAAESAFKLVQDAFDILSDPDKRKGFEIERNRSRPQPTSSEPTSSTPRNTKPSVNVDNDDCKAGHSSSYYDDWEAAEDTWLDEEEGYYEYEDIISGKVRLCPICGYPWYTKTDEKTRYSLLKCKDCDREFVFCF
ncbi:hypothetical protein MKW94_017868 [Papaver nudicaule]|uniref:J domain-containing protein n=1 Tax=Papaver nudicaule TaxID=74823 RepID=A0AA41S2X1_PAPNU|nr:hypothetical protein [Papaver nudicaule]